MTELHEVLRKIAQQDVLIFFTIGVAYIAFSTSFFTFWCFSVIKSRVAKRLAQDLLASPELLQRRSLKSRHAMVKRLEDLAAHSRGRPQDFAVALAAAHMLRHEYHFVPSVLLHELKRKNRNVISQIKNPDKLVTAEHLRHYLSYAKKDSKLDFVTSHKINFLTDRLQQNLKEVITYDHHPKSAA